MPNFGELILFMGMVDLISLSRLNLSARQLRYAYLKCFTVIATGLYGIYQRNEKDNSSFSDLFAHIGFCTFTYSIFQLKFNQPHPHVPAAVYVPTATPTQPDGIQSYQSSPPPPGQQVHYE